MSADLQRDIREVTHLRESFYSSLGTIVPEGVLNFDIPLEWWGYQKYFYGRLKEFNQYESNQIETALKERFGLATNVFIYSVDSDGDLTNNLVPNEKFKVFLKRGILYRESIGSREQERENAELDGFLKITEKLVDNETPDGTMMISISGTGIVENTFYPKNFIDIYERVKTENGTVVIKMTRFSSSNDYEEYIRVATKFNKDYFNEFEGPIDAWFLKNPILVKPQQKLSSPEELFSKIFNNEKKSMEEAEFQELLEYCMPLITNFINLLTSDVLNPEKLAENLNAILNKADLFEQQKRNKQETIIFQSSVEMDIFKLGRQTVRAVDGACGLSGGINLQNRFDNSVAKFGLWDSKGSRQFNCPACNHLNTRPHEELISRCQNPSCPNPTAVAC